MPRSRTPIVARFTQEQLLEVYATHFNLGYAEAKRDYKEQQRQLEVQRASLNTEQTRAVTSLIEACNANLSKAGYLIGKLNKDNSR